MVAACAVVALLSACGNGPADKPLRVFAAASLTEAFTDIGEEFEGVTGVPIEVSFAGSQTLVTQLANGAQADVLATADTDAMTDAARQGLVGEHTVIATNTLALITPPANPGRIETPGDIAAPGVRLVLASETAPIGRYSRRVLGRLGLHAALQNVVSEEEDAKGVLGKVVSGEADAGIVYVTDVTDRVRPIPLGVVDVVARYPVAVTRNAASPDAAERFVRFVTAGDGRNILSGAGFGPPVDGRGP